MFDPLPDEDTRISSANVQAEIYRECQDRGLECRLEYTHEVDDPRCSRDRICFDCAVLHDGFVVCAAEAKRYSDLEHLHELDTRQAWNYSLLPIPAYYVSRQRHAAFFAYHAQGIIQQHVSRSTRYGQIRIVTDGPDGSPQVNLITIEDRSDE